VLLRSRLLTEKGFAHAFPTRGADDEKLHALLGTDRIVQVKQVHGGRAIEAAAAGGAEADAIIGRCQSGRMAVGVRVADCVALLLADSHSGDVAAVHAGWRGVVAEVVPEALRALAGKSVFAAIGPCIGACCFEVGCDVAAQIARATTERAVVRVLRDKAYVDLRIAVREQLLSHGVAAERVEDVPGCTKHEQTRFHSYRRDGARSGRMLAAIATGFTPGKDEHGTENGNANAECTQPPHTGGR
jgi:YfiH family protein